MDMDVHAPLLPPTPAAAPDPRRRLPPPATLAASGLGLALSLAACSASPPALPTLHIDPARVSVSGLSSGAYMAQQLHLAFADRIHAAALLAGGPYGCARGDLQIALGGCMTPPAEALPDVVALAASVRSKAASGALAPIEALAGDRVLVWHGRLDDTISEPVSRAAAELYRQLHEAVLVVEDFDDQVAHLLPTAGQGGDCHLASSPHVAACGIDLAGQVIRTLYPETPEAPEAADGTLRAFDAARLADGDPPGAAEGYVYIPKTCQQGASCGLHIALHGCQQDAASIGTAFVDGAGYNRWADAANLVVLYPQARSSYMPLNPKACWDWWGYTGPDHDTRRGPQLRWIAAMARALGAPLD
jgi:poly(3-hydroxybutyrate) depolymerase